MTQIANPANTMNAKDTITASDMLILLIFNTSLPLGLFQHQEQGRREAALSPTRANSTALAGRGQICVP